MQLMQFFKTSSRRAESEIPGRLSDMVDMCGPFGTILGCAGRKEDNLLTIFFYLALFGALIYLPYTQHSSKINSKTTFYF